MTIPKMGDFKYDWGQENKLFIAVSSFGESRRRVFLTIPAAALFNAQNTPASSFLRSSPLLF